MRLVVNVPRKFSSVDSSTSRPLAAFQIGACL